MTSLLLIIILIISVIAHELAHGYMANYLGDPTARLQGRLTWNPLSHIDPVGSVLVPLITSLFGIGFGWAKPVPYNPYNLKNKRVGELLIAGAGPASNLLIAIIFGLIIRLALANGLGNEAFFFITSQIVIMNIALAVFNLIPLPPLDGSKFLFAALKHQYGKTRIMLETYAPLFLVLAVFVVWNIISPVIFWIFHALVGF